MPDNVRVVPLRRSALLRIVLFGTCALIGVSLCGAEVEKANNTDALNLGSSWTLGTAPTGTDVALWTANSARSSLTLGASVSWAGIKVSNPGGSVVIGAGNVLTLGTNGLVVNIGSGNALSLSHALDIAGDQTWTIGGSTGVGLSGALSGSNRTINIVSGGSGSYVNLYGSAANFRGTINYGGAARLNLRGAFAGTNVTVNLTAPRPVYADSTIGTVVIGDLATALTGAVLGSDSQNGAVTYEIGAVGNDSTWAGGIRNGGADLSKTTSIRKVGAGTWTLTGTNTYTGPTTILKGTLALSGGAVIANTPLITVSNGATLDVSGLSSSLTLRAGQTIANSGALTANLRGDLSVGPGMVALTYIPGTPGFNIGGGTLTLSSNTVITLLNTGNALAPGSYRIIGTNAGGAVAGTMPLVKVDNGGFGSGTSWWLAVSNAQLYLLVQSTTNLALTASPSPSAHLAPVTFATTLPADATGNVVFSTFNVPISTNQVANGLATSASVHWLPGGTNYITATYSGDAKYPQTTRTLIHLVTNAPTVYATWCMVWIDSNQSWWDSSNYQGATDFMGSYAAIDWANTNYVTSTFSFIRAAGVSAVVADLSNGWGWLNNRVQLMQSVAAAQGMKVCVAENSAGNLATFESHCKDIWSSFAGPTAPHASSYLLKDGKPVLVCYGIRSWFNAYVASAGPYRQKFTLVWSSGEDSNIDKWGWQLEPAVGPMGSSDSVFVTPSVKWASSSVSPDLWRKSQAWLDYTFHVARQSNPEFVIVGSFDDIHERNAWLPADTSGCIPGMQMRDVTGAINPTNFYFRVSEWILGRPSSIPGGFISDGCYTLTNGVSGLCLSMPNSVGTNLGCVGLTPVQAVSSGGLDNVFAFYHVGSNVYRIASLNSGLFLAATNSGDGVPIVQQWADASLTQRWFIAAGTNGAVTIQNVATGKLLDLGGGGPGAPVVQNTATNGAASQRWTLGLTAQIGPADPPALKARRAGDNIEVYWPAGYQNFVLQRFVVGGSLANDALWQNVDGIVSNSYSEALSNGGALFRLKSL